MKSSAASSILLLVVAISLMEACGQSCLKTFYKNQENALLYWAGVFFYAIVCFLLVMSYKYRSMGIVNVLWSGVSILVILGAGLLFFEESITRLDTLGVLLTVAGISCIVWEGNHDT